MPISKERQAKHNREYSQRAYVKERRKERETERKERIRAYRLKWYQLNKDRLRAYQKQYYYGTPEARDKWLEYHRIYQRQYRTDTDS